MKVRVISESEFTVQGHGVHTAYFELTNALKQVDGVEVIVNQRGKVDVTHFHTVGMYSLLYLLFGSGKKVVSAHVVPESFVGSLVGTKYWLPLATMYLRWFYNHADLVLAVSDKTKEDLEKLSVTKPIVVFHNVIDTSRYLAHPGDRQSARKALGLTPEGIIVISAGQVQPRKRVDSFIKTAKALPEITFIWVGGMPFGKAAAQSGKMERMIRTSPPNVIFPGILPLEKMRDYYHAANIFMLPSDQETFGLVVVEAAAAGLPIVLRDIPDYDETFRVDSVMSSETGFARAIQKLVTDKKYYYDMQNHAGQIAARFDSRAGAKKIVQYYRELLG